MAFRWFWRYNSKNPLFQLSALGRPSEFKVSENIMTSNKIFWALLTLLSCTLGHGEDLTVKAPGRSGAVQSQTNLIWLSPNEIVRRGFGQSRVVMMNEAHSGELRNVRTREIGKRILATAHELGVRHLAMEALEPEFADTSNRTRKLPIVAWGYLSQSEMRDLIQAALNLGWTISPYEANGSSWIASRFGPRPVDPEKLAEYLKKVREARLSMEYTNWRELEQARNLLATLKSLPADGRLLVWCGNGHLYKSQLGDWIPMGYQFAQLSGLNPFAINQTLTVEFSNSDSFGSDLVRQHGDELRSRSGTAGFIKEEAPDNLKNHPSDAFILSLDNKLE
jgi:hypothetical protein